MIGINKLSVINYCSSIIDIVFSVNKAYYCNDIPYLFLNHFKGFEVIFYKFRFKKEVFGWITRYRKLRKQDDMCTRLFSPFNIIDDFRDISFKISNGRINLCKGKP